MKEYTMANCPNGLNGIYKIDFPNGKTYIGLSNNIKRRIMEHNTDKRQPLLLSAIQKHGRITEFTVLEEGDFSREELNEKEKHYIKLYNSDSREHGYNLTEGGYSYLGVYNPNAKFSEAELELIKELLSDSELSGIEIAKSFNCSDATIQRINVGSNYHNRDWEYPIRKDKFTHKGSDNHNAKFQNLDDVIKDLKSASHSFSELALKYDCSIKTLRSINSGDTYFDSTLDYPIRKKKSPRKQVKSYNDEEISQMINLLIESRLSMVEIGKSFGCSRDYITEINQGRKFRKDTLQYPLRVRSSKRK